MKDFADRYLPNFSAQPLLILDVGSYDVNGSYRPLFENKNWHYRGLDIASGQNVDIVINDIYHWQEVETASVDVVISGQAFEHIEYFWQTFEEIYRVLKLGGLCCIIAPSSGPEHRYPVDCWRFFPDGLRAASRYVGLEVLETRLDDRETIDGEGNVWHDSVLIAKKS